jgi:hypothetical protein
LLLLRGWLCLATRRNSSPNTREKRKTTSTHASAS